MRNTSTQPPGDAQRLLDLLAEAGRCNCLRDPIANLLEGWEFTPAQIHSLMWLGYDGRLTMGALAKRVGATDKTITGIVDRLEQKKYVRRGRDESDRRVVTVELTPEGRESFEEIQALNLKKVGDLLSRLDETEREWLFRILGKLLEHSAPSSDQGEQT
jgi:DNA-binding MarR family transcriptional regulator